MPVWPDVSYYDICARNILEGGVHYRDVFDTNLPGMAWLHLGIRTLVGWSSEAIRLVDVLFVVLIVGLLAAWWRPLGGSRAARVWTAVALVFFYFSTSEWCHCQRDTWMLLPALAALYLRRRQVTRLTGTTPVLRRVVLWAWLEGLCWGAALWIKPHVAVPALVCWLVSTREVARTAAASGRRLLVDAAGLLAGGLLAGGLGIAWLQQTGAWPAFLNILLVWNQDYLPKGNYLARAWQPVEKFFPWGLVHLAALPAAVVFLWQAWVRAGEMADAADVPAERCRALLAAFYLGWLFQVVFLQWQYDYQMVPAVMLALTLLAGLPWPPWPVRGLAVAGFLALAAYYHPLFQVERLSLWGRCWQEGSTGEMRDRLSLFRDTNWADLERVADWLRQQGLQDGELNCYDWRLASLYTDLELRPATRFVFFASIPGTFPRHRQDFLNEFLASRHRFVVTDFTAVPGLGSVPRAAAVGPDGPLTLPPKFPKVWEEFYPWSEPIVFRAGRYAVHRVTSRPHRLWQEAGRRK
jgi:hypothetical protein